jgi:hypothetical protein
MNVIIINVISRTTYGGHLLLEQREGALWPLVTMTTVTPN